MFEMSLGDSLPNVTLSYKHKEIRLHDVITGHWSLVMYVEGACLTVSLQGLRNQLRDDPSFLPPYARTLGLCETPFSELGAKERALVRELQDIGQFSFFADQRMRSVFGFGMHQGIRNTSASGDCAANTQNRVFWVVTPDRRIQAVWNFPLIIDANFVEFGRVIRALKTTYGLPLATPANWTDGADLLILPSLSDTEAQQRYGRFKKVLSYFRQVPVDQVLKARTPKNDAQNSVDE